MNGVGLCEMLVLLLKVFYNRNSIPMRLVLDLG
jgi:hypothetical protein